MIKIKELQERMFENMRIIGNAMSIYQFRLFKKYNFKIRRP